MGAAVRHGVAGVLVCEAVLAVVAGGLATGFAPAGRRGDPLAWCQAGLLLLGLAVHAPAELRLTATDEALPAPIDLTLAVAVTPLVLTGLLLLVTGLLGRRAERAAPSADARALLRAAVVTAGAFAAGAVLLGGLLATGARSGGGLPPGWAAGAGVDLVQLAPGALAVALAGTLLGRAAQRARQGGLRSGLDLLPEAALGWARDLRHVRNLVLGVLVATLATLAVAGLVAVVHQALVASTLDLAAVPGVPGAAQQPVAPAAQQAGAREVAGALVGLVALLPGLAVLAAGVALGGPAGVTLDEQGRRLLTAVGFDAPADSRLGLFSGSLPARAYLVWLPLLVVTVLVGIRAELARRPSTPAGASAWRVPAAAAGVWALVAFLTQVSVQGEAGGLLEGVPSVRLTGGLDVAGTAVAALLWAGLSVGAGHVLTRPVAAAVPGLAARIGGPRLHHDWALLLGDAVLVRGGRIPRSLHPAVEALVAGARPAGAPLRAAPVRDRVVVAGALAAALVLLTGAGVRAVADDTVLGPAATVRAFAARLAAHDAAGALALVEPGPRGPLLAAAGVAHPPAAVRVLAVDVRGDRATVDVGEEIDGTTLNATFRLRRHTQKGLFARWLLDAPFTRLRVPLGAGAGSASVDGVDLGTDDTALVLPGRHTVSRSADGLFAASSVDVSAAGNGEQEADVPLGLVPGADAVAAAAVRRHLDECVAAGPVVPVACPFQPPPGVEDLRWSVVRYPVVSAAVDGSLVSVTTLADGEVLLTGTTTDAYGGPVPYAEPAPLHVAGTLSRPGPGTNTVTFAPEQP